MPVVSKPPLQAIGVGWRPVEESFMFGGLREAVKKRKFKVNKFKLVINGEAEEIMIPPGDLCRVGASRYCRGYSNFHGERRCSIFRADLKIRQSSSKPSETAIKCKACVEYCRQARG